MGTFEQGTQGAFRFEVWGMVDGRPLLVIEHVTRIDDDCAPDWPRSTAPGSVTARYLRVLRAALESRWRATRRRSRRRVKS